MDLVDHNPEKLLLMYFLEKLSFLMLQSSYHRGSENCNLLSLSLRLEFQPSNPIPPADDQTISPQIPLLPVLKLKVASHLFIKTSHLCIFYSFSLPDRPSTFALFRFRSSTVQHGPSPSLYIALATPPLRSQNHLSLKPAHCPGLPNYPSESPKFYA